MVEAIIYILRVGCPWRDLPAIYGPWNSVYTRLAAGPAADVIIAQGSALPALRGKITVADKAYDSDGFRAQLWQWRSRAGIPPRSNRLQPANWHRGHYLKRHKVENLFQRLKRYRRIGTRYEKNDLYFLGFVQLAIVLDWLKN